MPSSTSNFRRHIPSAPLVRVVFTSLVAALIVLSGLELFWRSRGHVPSVADDMDLWSYYRRQVDEGGSNLVVLLGASRIQLDFSTKTFREMFPNYRLVQLAIDGEPPLAALKDLARSDKFKGVVICSITADHLERRYHDSQQPWVDYYHKKFTFEKRVNRFMTRLAQSSLALNNPYLSLKRVIPQVCRTGRLPRPWYLTTYPDRSRAADYSKVNVAFFRQARLRMALHGYIKNRPSAPHNHEWLKQALEIEPFIRRIQNRGGKVVFVRLPTDGGLLMLDRRFYPRESFWDRFAAVTRAETIHFQDAAGLAGFTCPDASHLSSSDAPKFTRALAEELLRRGLITKGD